MAVGEVVIIKSEEKNRGMWLLGIVKELYPWRDGVVRAVKVRPGRNLLETGAASVSPGTLSRVCCPYTFQSSLC